VTDGSCGWLVPAGDVEQLANAMADCLSRSEDALVAMGRHGRERVLQRHDIAVEVGKLLGLFRGSPG
jgi:colanic acid/amylovoran biosynthesis glycosyltransferase